MKGSAELLTPTSAIGRQCRRSPPMPERPTSSGSSNSAAPVTRNAASGTGPKCGAAKRMNRNDAPHSAASSTSSTVSRGFMRAGA